MRVFLHVFGFFQDAAGVSGELDEKRKRNRSMEEDIPGPCAPERMYRFPDGTAAAKNL